MLKLFSFKIANFESRKMNTCSTRVLLREGAGNKRRNNQLWILCWILHMYDADLQLFNTMGNSSVKRKKECATEFRLIEINQNVWCIASHHWGKYFVLQSANHRLIYLKERILHLVTSVKHFLHAQEGFSILLCLIKYDEEYFAIISHSFTLWDVVGSTARSPRSNDWNDDRRDDIYPINIGGCGRISLETDGHCLKISQRWILKYSATLHCGRTMCYYRIALGLSKTQSLSDMLKFDMFTVDLSADSIPLERSNTSTKYWCSSVSRPLFMLNVQKDIQLSICWLSNNQSSREKKRKAQHKASLKDTQMEGGTKHEHRWRLSADRWKNCKTQGKKQTPDKIVSFLRTPTRKTLVKFCDKFVSGIETSD